MKKFTVVALSAVVACGSFFTSCDSIPSGKPNLSSEQDSVSYAMGAMIAGQVEMQLRQMGLYNDTLQMASMLRSEAALEKDSVKRLELEKKIPAKLDSIAKANSKNLSDFLSGLQEGIKASPKQSARSLGTSLGLNLSQQFEPVMKQLHGEDEANLPKVDTKIFMNAVNTIVKKEEAAIADPNMWFQGKMQAAQMEAQKKAEEKLKEEYAPQIEAGKKFMEENKTKEGVVTLPSGIQYKIIKEGKGPKPTNKDMVSVNYRGTLIDGTEFDSSFKRNQPFKFNVQGGVIQGWSEIVQLMPVGSTWEVVIPYELAYGSADRGTIKPFSTLVFEIELLSIDK